MSRISIKKFSVAAGLFSFSLIFFGSWIYGARVISSFFRGLEGFVIFSLLTWLILRGWSSMKPKDHLEESKGVNLDQTA